jgi:hypothetical protein
MFTMLLQGEFVPAVWVPKFPIRAIGQAKAMPLGVNHNLNNNVCYRLARDTDALYYVGADDRAQTGALRCKALIAPTPDYKTIPKFMASGLISPSNAGRLLACASDGDGKLSREVSANF